ncbi:NAD-dependent epimerase/dehydratase family protein [Synoicihabitans lomoniglobus]|uniref:NAD-dependent epimerase/dehydratase family protein n=1 Tax=Synoicihabitans lomoniglobus TaxID=2909285 RepID=A0AAF0I623_9BACT|nr:NAD-dependent epimerase/dehydratase family protein [Opitutaceae bacterium LMO-M01]WED67320.1 NAD-dependent epimerase/dehydratase family protein [Opitutaceae bacterium LMO-M01]
MKLVFAHGFLQGMQLFVVGAGYVGRRVATAALRAGASVTALTRNPATAESLRAQGVGVIVADLATDSWHTQAPGNPDFVLNCVSSGGGGIAGYEHSYLNGARSLRRWGESLSRPGHLIYTGSTSVYLQDGGVTVDESMPAESGEPRARILRDTEDTLRSWPGPWTLLRLAGIYGPGRHHLLDGLRTRHPTVPGRGGHHLNLIHVDDIASAIIAAWAQPKASATRVFNVADNSRATKADVVTWLADRLGQTTPPFTGISAPGRRAHMPDRIISNDLLKRTLGWSPQYPTFREGYAAILEA